MAKDGYIRRQVAFNLNDPFQRKLYEHTTKYTNFSAYIKALILTDYIRKESDKSSD